MCVSVCLSVPLASWLAHAYLIGPERRYSRTGGSAARSPAASLGAAVQTED